MKRLSVVLCLGFFVSLGCFAQIQTGNASFNSSKTGFAISHSSLSFNTRVKVTNLRNNRSVEAVVNGRIPIDGERIADISRDAGTALGMGSGLTLVELEVLPPHDVPGASVPSGGAAVIPAGNASAAEGSPRPPETAPSSPVSPVPQVSSQGESSSSAREQSSPAAPVPAPQILPVQSITDVQYVQVPGGNCCNSPLLIVVLALLIVVIILLLVILILFLRRLFLWPWHYPVWYRRHLLYAKKHRR
ncbi:MAG: hypothetical protein LBK08_09385 [Treponema sp.]|jgi:hypothetical protein|nr:hypothetical protein [Treponema sp.]